MLHWYIVKNLDKANNLQVNIINISDITSQKECIAYKYVYSSKEYVNIINEFLIIARKCTLFMYCYRIIYL